MGEGRGKRRLLATEVWRRQKEIREGDPQGSWSPTKEKGAKARSCLGVVENRGEASVSLKATTSNRSNGKKVFC